MLYIFIFYLGFIVGAIFEHFYKMSLIPGSDVDVSDNRTDFD